MTYEPNPYNTLARQKTIRETLMFLVFPLTFMLLTIIVITWALAFDEHGGWFGLTVWSYMATILFTMMLCAGNIVLAALFFALCAIPIWLMIRLPPLFKKAHDILIRVEGRVDQVSTGMTDGLIRAHSIGTTAAHMTRAAQRTAARYLRGPQNRPPTQQP